MVTLQRTLVCFLLLCLAEQAHGEKIPIKNICESLSPCGNGGTCYPISESDGSQWFVCLCARGFIGRTCTDVYPRIDLDCGPTFVEQNTNVTLPRCNVTGSPIPEVRWSKVGGSLSAESVAEDGQLKLFNVTEQDAGQYKCKATNAVGSDEAETNVEVIQFVRPPQVLNTYEKFDETVECRATTEPVVAGRWSKTNEKLPEGLVLRDGTLKLTNIQMEDAGKYVCTVTIGNLKSVAEMQLNVRGSCEPEGVQDPSRIPDSSMTASSTYNILYYPHYGRLHGRRGKGAWCPETRNNRNDYLQIDMGAERTVCAVATQGQDVAADRTNQYKLSVSRDGFTWSFYQEKNVVKEFPGNFDPITVVKNKMEPVAARYVRFYPVAHNGWPCLRVEIFGLCKPVGVQDPSRIPDSSMTASSYDSGYHFPTYGRLHGTRGMGAWCPVWNNNRNDYLQIDMGAQRSVCAVATQGKAHGPACTTQYKLSVSRDGVTWSFYQENNAVKEFPGNTDRNTVVRNYLSVDARYVRFYPVNYITWPCLRVEIFVLN